MVFRPIVLVLIIIMADYKIDNNNYVNMMKYTVDKILLGSVVI